MPLTADSLNVTLLGLLDVGAAFDAMVSTTRSFCVVSIPVSCVAQFTERRSLADELTPSCARPAADGYGGKPSSTGQPTRPTQPFVDLPGSTKEY